jgi:hypothetical protein
MTRSKLFPGLLTLSIVAVSIGVAFQGALAAEHTLMPSPQTVHIGYFSAALKPVLTIDSGDIVIIESTVGLDPADADASGVIPPSAVPEYARAIRREVTDRGPGPHILTGPVFVNGAMPGDVSGCFIRSHRCCGRRAGGAGSQDGDNDDSDCLQLRGNPVENGFVSSLNRPGGNLTGE